MTALDLDARQLVAAAARGRRPAAGRGLPDPERVVEEMVEAGADAVLAGFGMVKRHRERLIGQLPVVLRLDGGLREAERPTAWRLLHRVEDAQLLGVDAVYVSALIGAVCELESMEVVAQVTGECLDLDLPVMVRCRLAAPGTQATAADACRIGFEHGADLVVADQPDGTDELRRMVAVCPVPVLVAGLSESGSGRVVLERVAEAMAGGARGVVLGRAVWEHPDPAGMVQALRAVIHDGASPEKAAELLPA
jgi:DhnA family fructose-bisphosphate aldolase class Ia